MINYSHVYLITGFLFSTPSSSTKSEVNEQLHWKRWKIYGSGDLSRKLIFYLLNTERLDALGGMVFHLRKFSMVFPVTALSACICHAENYIYPREQVNITLEH